jgi:hypothetical protein
MEEKKRKKTFGYVRGSLDTTTASITSSSVQKSELVERKRYKKGNKKKIRIMRIGEMQRKYLLVRKQSGHQRT